MLAECGGAGQACRYWVPHAGFVRVGVCFWPFNASPPPRSSLLASPRALPLPTIFLSPLAQHPRTPAHSPTSAFPSRESAAQSLHSHSSAQSQDQLARSALG